jgi:carboxypeptidase family protein
MRLHSLAATLLLLFFVSNLYAQTPTGEVNGTISDPNGGALPGAMVKLINQATKIETEVNANYNGYFTFINVKPGSSVLRVEVRNFKGLRL